MITTRQVHRLNYNRQDIVVGRIHRATGADRARYSYQPLEDLPEVVYGGECFVTGDAWWWPSWGEARADIVRWSYLGRGRP